MARNHTSLFFDLGLVGTAALVASVSLSLALEPLIAGDLRVADPPERQPDEESFANLDQHRLSQLVGVPLTQKAVITHTPAPSPLRFLVAGTVVGRYTAAAILIDPTARSSLIVRVGDLLDDAVVTAIERGRVILRRDGRDEVLDARAPASPITSQQTAAIRTLAPDRIAVPRSVIDSASQNFTEVGRGARLLPAMVGGKSAFRIDRIQPGSLFEQLGMQNGDALLSVDDIPVDRLDALMQHYANLPRARSVQVAFVRGGQVQRRTYEING